MLFLLSEVSLSHFKGSRVEMKDKPGHCSPSLCFGSNKSSQAAKPSKELFENVKTITSLVCNG